MPARGAQEIGRPVPSRLEIEVLNKFKENDHRNVEEWMRKLPHLVKPCPPVGAPGKGGVNWVGLNADPCKAKYLAKCGITLPPPAAPCQPPSTRLRSAKSRDGGPARSGTGSVRLATSSTMPDLVPGTGASLASKSQRSTHVSRRSLNSVLTSKSVQDLVQKEVRKQLNKRSCHEHYLEQKLHFGDEFGTKSTDDVTDLKEKLYYGVSQTGDGRDAYLKARHKIMPQDRFYEPASVSQDVGWFNYLGPGKFVGKQLKTLDPDKFNGSLTP